MVNLFFLAFGRHKKTPQTMILMIVVSLEKHHQRVHLKN